MGITLKEKINLPFYHCTKLGQKVLTFCTDLNGRMAKQKYCLEIIPCTLIYFVNQIRQHIWVGQNGGKANLKKK